MDDLIKGLPNGEAIYKQYQADSALCKQAGELEYQCTKKVGEKYSRLLPGMDGAVYPWSNYDWDYTTFIDNNYNADETGATPEGSFSALFANPEAMMKLGKGFIMDPNPSSNSKAAQSDLTECDPSSATYKGCEILNQIRKSQLNQKPPDDDPFFRKQSLDGKDSSSYFVRVGICPKMSMSEEECNAKGWQWVGNNLFQTSEDSIIPEDFIPGMCFKPRYAFVRNEPGLKIDISAIKALNNDMAKGAKLASGMFAPKGTDQTNQYAIEMSKEMGNKVADMDQTALNAMLSIYDGAVPSAFGDILDLSPVALLEILDGNSTADFVMMDCDYEPIENFVSCPMSQMSKSSKRALRILGWLLFIIVILVLFSYWNASEKLVTL